MSWALDTNGQNARYVEASRRHGSDPEILRAFAIGVADPAGVVARFKAAADKGAGLVIREAHRARNYLDFPVDILWSRHNEHEVRRLAADADVIHLNNSLRAYVQLRLAKPALLHHHGSLFRKDPAKMLDAAKRHRMVQAVSTVDLQKPNPDILHWLPTAYDLDALAAIREANRRPDDGLVRVVSCPTNRALKHTAELERAVKRLQAEGLPVELVVVEGKTNSEALATKGTADIVFDQVAFGYGCNAIEAWGMGLPVIAGAEDPWVIERMRTLWGDLPFYEATPGTIADAIRALALSPDLRTEYAAKGEAHARRFHAEGPALARLAELYAEAIRHFDPPRVEAVPVAAVTFQNLGNFPIYPGIWGPDGTARVSDPFVIERLHYFATKRTRLGIREVSA